MSDGANITSLEAVVQFTAALRQFEDSASGALLTLDQQIQRAMHWLEYEAPAFWQQQIRRSFDDVARTRSALETCRMRTVAGNRPSCIEEEKAYRAAKRKLETAQEKLELVRRWTIRIHREVDEYRGRIGRLKQHLDGEVPRTLGLLERIQMTLEGYLGRRIGQPDDTTEPAPPPETPDGGT